MIKAQQLNLIQTTNIEAINIRYDELKYYSNIYTSIGIFAITIMGFVLSALQQVTSTGFDTTTIYGSVFFVTVTIAITSSCHVVMITLFAYVYGNNLAIRGPAGSMLQALNGMLFERNEIIFAFVIMVIFYIISTNFSNWVIMDFEAAIVCQAIMLTFTLLTYRTTLRIYNRFKIVRMPHHDWEEENKDSDLSAQLNKYYEDPNIFDYQKFSVSKFLNYLYQFSTKSNLQNDYKTEETLTEKLIKNDRIYHHIENSNGYDDEMDDEAKTIRI